MEAHSADEAAKTARDVRAGGATPLVVDVAFPFTLGTPKYGPSRAFVGDHGAKAAYVDALEAELASLDEEVRARPVGAVHLAGGASLMSADKVCHLVRDVRKTLALAPGCEVSIDVEPLTVGTPSLTDWTSCGVTRVNLLALSVHDRELAAFGARHDRERLQDALSFLARFHVPHVCLELAYGLPEQTPASWEKSLRTAADLGCAEVRVRPLVDARAQVAVASEAEAGAQAVTLPLPSREERRALYDLACELLPRHGYEQYAPGDFVRAEAPHGRCRHDELVRGGADVLGLGAGAHTRMDGFLYENALDFDLYVRESANFEAVVRNPLREGDAARAARVEPALEQLTPAERFERLERLGAALAR